MGFKSKKVKDRIRRKASYFNDLITRSVYNSNAIEGNTLSYFETYAILFSKDEIINKRRAREIYEAINLKYAIDYVMRNSNKDISLDMIIKIATFINKNINKIDNFREDYVRIKGSQHIPPSHLEIRHRLMEVLYKYCYSSEDIDIKIARFHIDFERIHPFQDGNGRTGRVLIFKEYINNGLLPPVITVEQRTDYMNLLENYDIEGMARLLRENRMAEEYRIKHLR